MIRILLISFIILSGCSDLVERHNVRPDGILQLKEKGWLPKILSDSIPSLSIAYNLDTNEGCAYFPMTSDFLKKDIRIAELKLSPTGRDLITRLINSYADKTIDLTHCDIYKYDIYYIVKSNELQMVFIPFQYIKAP
jgi:hypothetical protein